MYTKRLFLLLVSYKKAGECLCKINRCNECVKCRCKYWKSVLNARLFLITDLALPWNLVISLMELLPSCDTITLVNSRVLLGPNSLTNTLTWGHYKYLYIYMTISSSGDEPESFNTPDGSWYLCFKAWAYGSYGAGQPLEKFR